MGTVYLVWAKDTNRYKIGFTKRKIEERMRELSSGQSPYPLELVKKVVCDKAPEVESKLHERFSACRSYGEWFEFDVKEVIEVKRFMDFLVQRKKGVLGLPNLLSFPIEAMIVVSLAMGFIAIIQFLVLPNLFPGMEHSVQEIDKYNRR